MRPRILFLSPRHPDPPDRGDRVRVFHLVRELAKHADVTLMCFGDGEAGAISGVRTLVIHRGPSALVSENLREFDPTLPIQVRFYLDRVMRQRVELELRTSIPDVIHATTVRMAAYLPPPGPWHRHLDFIDALSVNAASRADISGPLAGLVSRLEATLLRRFEARCMCGTDTASLVSERDRLLAPGLAGAAVIPNGVDTSRFPYREPATTSPELLFFGNLGYFHNVEPARFVASEVVPRVRAVVPAARLKIVGARPGAVVRRLDRLAGVDVTGPVVDMAASLHQAAVAVVPMFSGSGIKNKVLESFSSGLPVVTNQLGIQGVDDAISGRHFLGAESAEEMAAACVLLLHDVNRRRRLASDARRLVEDSYAWSAQAARLLHLYQARRAR